MKVEFREEDHSYWVNGERYPGVTEILRETGQAKDWSDVPAYYRERGSAVHKAVELWIKGTLDEESLDPVIVPYFEQFTGWARKKGMAGLWLAENSYGSEKMVYAGTIDLIANQTIYDIKCSKKLDNSSTWQYSMQGAAYRTLAKENLGHDYPFCVLLLTGSGEAVEVPLVCSYRAWGHIMGIYNEKKGRNHDN